MPSAGACRRLLHDDQVGHCLAETLAVALGAAAVYDRPHALDRGFDLEYDISSIRRTFWASKAAERYACGGTRPADLALAVGGEDGLLSAIFEPYLRPTADAPEEGLGAPPGARPAVQEAVVGPHALAFCHE